jgi:hypothetical protein
VIADPREGQIERLKEQVGQLKKRLATQEQQNAGLTAFRVQAVSQLAAQHEEIIRLRAAAARGGGVRGLASVIGYPPARSLEGVSAL